MPKRVIASVEELKSLAGQEVAVSEPFQITQDQINRFADVSGDHQWIHVDVDRARRESPYKTPIAHGFLTLSLLSRLAGDTLQVGAGRRMGINYGLNRVRFAAPVPAGSTLRARFRLVSVKDLADSHEIIWDVQVNVEGQEKPALVAEWVTRYYL